MGGRDTGDSERNIGWVKGVELAARQGEKFVSLGEGRMRENCFELCLRR